MLECAFLSVDDITAVVRVEVARIAQHLKETADAFLCLFLRLLLHVDGLVLLVEAAEDAIHKLEELERRLVVELDHRKVAHKGRTIQTIDDQFDLLRVEVRSFREDLGVGALILAIGLSFVTLERLLHR